MKKLLTALVGGVVLLGSLSSAGAVDVPGEQFVISGPSDGVSSVGVVIEDSQFIKNQFASLQSFSSENSKNDDKPTAFHDCPGIGSAGCEANLYFNYKAFFGNCASTSEHDCVLSVTAKGPDGVSHQATFVEDLPGKTKFSFEGEPNLNLPNGSSSFVVRIADAPHEHGDLYLVTVNVDGHKAFDQKSFQLDDFRAGIFAVTLVDGKYYPAGPSQELKFFDRVGAWTYKRIASGSDGYTYASCAQASASRCAIAWPLPTNTEFSISLKLRTKVSGWLHGRLSDVAANISTANDGDQLITVSGKPVVVPAVFTWFHLDAQPASIAKYYANDPRFMNQGTGFSTEKSNSILKDYISYQEREFPEALAWYEAIGDKASSSATAWSFRSIENGNLPGSCNTSNKQLTGIVTTNSNMFIAQPPKFNAQDASLDYKVASPHYLPDGTVFKGTYNLVMRSDYARCIYGFTSAPVAASVSILSADGTSQVATTVLGERNGWLYLSANNFTFSSPTLKVKLTQEVAKSAVKKITISCKKGSVIKKVSGSNPKCPTGYKKI